MKRLGIYLIYDKQNIVDNYIGYFLKEFKTCVSALVVVCNMPCVVRGGEILEEYADQVYFRQNLGLDAGGYQDVICNFMGWNAVLQYDELVLANDSMFGPFRSMKNIFSEMDEKPVDFWGLSKHGTYRKAGIDEFPEHIQTFFLTVRSNMLHSSTFRSYWETLPQFPSFNRVVREFEMEFTSHFSRLGFTYDVLADNEANNSNHFENNYTQFSKISYELIQKRNFPFLKRKQLAEDSLEIQTQENLRQAIEYIDQETEYDVNLIWENILRLHNMTDLQRTLGLQYVVAPNPVNGAANAAILVFISYQNSADTVLEYLERWKDVCSVWTISHNPDFLKPYREKKYQCVVVQERRQISYLTEFDLYDCVCVLHDTDLTSQARASCIGKSYFYNIWENLAKNAEQISGIVNLFQQKPKLGFLAPPQPNFGPYFAEIGKGWREAFQPVQSVAAKLKLNSPMSKEKAPYRITNNFWIRGSILRRVRELEEKDYQYTPYLWSYLAQDKGYYSGIVESPEYAGMNEANLQHYLAQLADQVRRQYGDFRNFCEMQERIAQPALESFCRRFAKIYVYGTGMLAKQYQKSLTGIEAYIVSDDQVKAEHINGVPVYYLSETPLSEACGIVLCLNRENQAQVVQLLKKRGFENYIGV